MSARAQDARGTTKDMAAQPSPNFAHLASPKAPVRVLVGEASDNTATNIDSVLRDAGIATRIHRTDDLIELRDAIAASDVDIAYIATSLPDFTDLMPKLREANPHMPLIAISLEHPQWTSAEAMTMGASDLVCLMDHEHLTQVSLREIEHVSQRLRNLVLAQALREAEDRCVLLLKSAKGLHGGAVEGFRELGGQPLRAGAGTKGHQVAGTVGGERFGQAAGIDPATGVGGDP